MNEDAKHLLNIVNASGFLFQLRVEDEVNTWHHKREFGWKVVSREHRWVDPLWSNEGFIDLVLQSRGIGRMVIECKRVKEGVWIFLIVEDRVNMARAQLLWTYVEEGQKPISDWDDFKVTPHSPEASFCIVRGQGEKDTPMLERLSGVLLRSTESLACEENDQRMERKYGPAIVYIPSIITNAELRICRVNPKDIDLTTGMLTEAEFEVVPFLRFRKSLSTNQDPLSKSKSLTEAAQHQERTVFIINASHLSSFLKGTEIHLSEIGKWPWNIVIEQE